MGHVIENVHGLSTTEKLTLIILSNYADEKDECWPSFETLSKRVGVNRRNTIRVMASLEAKGLIRRVEERPYKPTKYRLSVPATSVIYDTSVPDNTSVTSDTTLVSPVTLPSVTGDTSSSVTSDTQSLSKPLKTPQRTLREGAREKNATKFPADFEPPYEWAAAELGMSPPAVDTQVPRMRDWALSKGETRKDWIAFARNWLRKEYESPSRRANPNGTPVEPKRAPKPAYHLQHEGSKL
jgi:hypothetical protein